MNIFPPAFARVENAFFRLLEKLMVVLLAGMVVMVFGNVVLRWVSNSGILISEEMSRFFFVWLTFIGAVVVMREHAHLGVEAFVARLGNRGRLACMVTSDLLILLCCAVFFWGTWQQSGVNATNIATVSGISMLWIFGVGYFTAVGIGVMVAVRLLRALRGGITERELAIFAGAFEDAEAEHIKRGLE